MRTARTAPTPEPMADMRPIAEQLRSRLLALDFPAFARCVCRLMEALGYEDARLAGRREWKGYNRPGGGGYDLEACLPGGLAPRRVVAQIKQFDGLTVHQRNVDELRGACLRAGAAEGLLVTTSAFSEVVCKHAAFQEDPTSEGPAGILTLIAPVRLIDGEELVGLLIHHRLGVRERGLSGLRLSGSKKTGTRKLVMDEAFFRGITAFGDITAFQGSAAPSTAKPPAPDPLVLRPLALLRSWRVTIRISSGARSNMQHAGSHRQHGIWQKMEGQKDDKVWKEDADRKGGR